jgi:bifunctional non-homologous end joining protein LigD
VPPDAVEGRAERPDVVARNQARRLSADGAAIRTRTRRGYDWTDRFPLIVEAASRLRATTFLLDGEGVILRSDGVSDFDALHDHRRDSEVQLLAFDMLELDGEDLRPEPLERRKAGLAKLLRRSDAGIQLTEHLEAPGHVVFAHACLLGLEGIVSKRRDAPYRHGRCRTWLKIKNPESPAALRVWEDRSDENRNYGRPFRDQGRRSGPYASRRSRHRDRGRTLSSAAQSRSQDRHHRPARRLRYPARQIGVTMTLRYVRATLPDKSPSTVDDDWLLYCGRWQVGRVHKAGGSKRDTLAGSLTGPHTPEAPVKKSGEAATVAEAKDQLVAAMRAWAVWAGLRTPDGGRSVVPRWVLTKDYRPQHIAPIHEAATDWLLISGGFVVGRVHRPSAGPRHWSLLGTTKAAPIEQGGWADSIDAAKADLLSVWQARLEWAEL